MWDCLHPSDFQLIPDLHHTQQPYVGFASVDSSRPRQVEVVSWQVSASSCWHGQTFAALLHLGCSSVSRKVCESSPESLGLTKVGNKGDLT